MGIAFAVLGLLTGPVAASSFAPAKTRTPLQRGLAFYKGSTITIVSGTVGGGTDLADRALAPLLASYLHAAAVNVLNAGSAGGIPGQDALAAATPNGLTIGGVNAGSAAAATFTHTPGYNFNLERLSWIASNGPTPVILVAAASSPYTSYASLINASPAPTLLTVNSGTSTADVQMLLGLLKPHVQLITAYASATAVLSGFQRGDGPLAILQYSSAESLMSSGFARPIAITAIPPLGTLDRKYVVSTPTFAGLVKQYLPKNASKTQLNAAQVFDTFVKSTFPLVTQTKVPADRLVALRAAVVWAYKQPAFKVAALAAGDGWPYVDPVKAKAAYVAMVANGSVVACYIEGTC